jgi:lysophospholipase L1-like esterase
MKRGKAIAVNVLLVALSVGIAFGALEVVLRATDLDRGDWYAAGPERLTFLRDHVRKNPDGFRDRDFARARTPGVQRILAVGDSFTFGDGVEDVAKTWPKVLETSLNAAGIRAEVFNLGIPGTNTAFQRGKLGAVGWSLSPDRVILAFVLNDPEPPGANTVIVPTRLNPPLLPLGRLDTTLTRASRAYAWLRGRRNALWERFGWKESYADYVRSLYRPGPDWDAWVHEAKGLCEDARARGVPLTVALFPLMRDLEADPFRPERVAAAKVWKEAGAHVVDLSPAFRGRPSSELCVSPTDAHPNAEGHRLAGEYLAQMLGAP